MVGMKESVAKLKKKEMRMCISCDIVQLCRLQNKQKKDIGLTQKECVMKPGKDIEKTEKKRLKGAKNLIQYVKMPHIECMGVIYVAVVAKLKRIFLQLTTLTAAAENTENCFQVVVGTFMHGSKERITRLALGFFAITAIVVAIGMGEYART